MLAKKESGVRIQGVNELVYKRVAEVYFGLDNKQAAERPGKADSYGKGSFDRR